MSKGGHTPSKQNLHCTILLCCKTLLQYSDHFRTRGRVGYNKRFIILQKYLISYVCNNLIVTLIFMAIWVFAVCYSGVQVLLYQPNEAYKTGRQDIWNSMNFQLMQHQGCINTQQEVSVSLSCRKCIHKHTVSFAAQAVPTHLQVERVHTLSIGSS